TSPPTPLHKWRGEITQEFQDWVLDAAESGRAVTRRGRNPSIRFKSTSITVFWLTGAMLG
ncbi:MAG TPA: hypothetical protein VEB40_13730, partial [Flavipsychrobacter sp.]|nr:hypothetical protein [Flavipsychrobacter sp.]